jgi:hypothetical protein
MNAALFHVGNGGVGEIHEHLLQPRPVGLDVNCGIWGIYLEADIAICSLQVGEAINFLEDFGELDWLNLQPEFAVFYSGDLEDVIDHVHHLERRGVGFGDEFSLFSWIVTQVSED